MSVLLVDACNSCEFSDIQKSFFWEHVLGNFSQNPYASPRDIASSCLSELRTRFDNRVTSAERSLHTVILELAIALLEYRCIEEAGILIGVLTAMFHSSSYINSQDWFDCEVDQGSLPMGERVFLCTAMVALGCRYIPDISECTESYIWEQINSGKEKIR